MSEDNNFLNSYIDKNNNEKKDDKKEVKKEEDKDLSFKEENKFVKPKETEHVYDKIKSSNKLLKNIVISVISLLVLVIIGVIIIVSLNRVSVPSFSTWDSNDLMLWANENKVLASVEESYSESFEEGAIISLSVYEGDKIKKGEIVKAVISKGPDLTIEVVLPDIINMSKTEIEKWVAANYMDKVRISTSYDKSVEIGKVISVEINDDTIVDNVKRDTPIYIIISKGVEPIVAEAIILPNLKTMSVAEIVLYCQENKLSLVIKEEYSEYVYKDSLIAQEPLANTKVYKDDEITINVSKGKLYTMADLTYFTKEDALDKCATLGLSVKVIEKYTNNLEGSFISQSIAKGTTIEEGMKIELTYSLGSLVSISNFTGDDIYNLEEYIGLLNEKNAGLTIVKSYTENSSPIGTIINQDLKNVNVNFEAVIRVIVSSGTRVIVPDFVAPINSLYQNIITREDAIKMAEVANLIVVFERVNNSSRLEGEVWSQSIQSGIEVAGRSVITLKYNPVVSTIKTPNLIGLTKQQIRTNTEFVNLEIVFLNEGNSSNSKVVSQSVSANNTVAYGTTIEVSFDNYHVDNITIPNFSRLSKEESIDLGKSLGLNLVIKESYGDIASGSYIYQSISPNQSISPDTELVIEYSKGNMIYIPDFINESYISLETWIQEVNNSGASLLLSVSFIEDTTLTNTILTQTNSLTEVDLDSTIHVTVSLGATVIVPDFVNETASNYGEIITIQDAQLMAYGLDITLVFIGETNPNVFEGEIFSQSINANNVVNKGSVITLKYNPVVSLETVPDFIGKTITQIQGMSEYNNLDIVFVKGIYDAINTDKVYTQSKEKDLDVVYGSEIILTYYSNILP